MLNRAQRKFRKEMKNLQQEGYLEHQDFYHYPPRSLSRKRPFWSLSVIGIVVLVLIFASVPQKIFDELIVHKHKQMNTYLVNKSNLDIESSTIVEELLKQLPTEKTEEYQSKIKNAHSRFEVIYKKSIELEEPEDFSKHKQAFVALMNHKRIIIRILEVGAETGFFDTNKLNNLISELTQLSTEEQNALIEAFVKAEVEYQLQSDGSVKYWYKTDAVGKSENRKAQIINQSEK